MSKRAVLVIGAIFVSVLCGSETPGQIESEGGLISLKGGNDGATLIITGNLKRDEFLLESMKLLEGRPAGRSSDPDQFRVVLLGEGGARLQTIRMWSPLLVFEWADDHSAEIANVAEERLVSIEVPASLELQSVAFTWPDGAVISRLDVRQVIQDFCSTAINNRACSLR